MKAVPALLAAAVATLLTVAGTRDFECYENAFVSLNRGTAMATATVAGQPVYTLALGLGTRLPLHGNLGASPAAAAARFLPAPATFWLLIALSVAAAALVAGRAIEPVAGPAAAVAALALLFVSPPLVAYTVYNDWPETAVTYCALVAGVFAPHAWMAAGESGARRRPLETAGLLAVVASLLAAAHPGYWSQIAAAMGISGLLLFARPVGARERWLALAGVAAAAVAGTSIHLPDFLHELGLAAGLGRDAQGATDTLIRPHLFPLVTAGAKHPFALLPLSLTALATAGLVPGRRALVAGCALAALAFASAAVVLSPGTLGIGPLVPTASWALRDPAIVFAVMSAAFAAPAIAGRAAGAQSTIWRRRGLGVALALGCLQGAGYAVALLRDAPGAIAPWNHDPATPGARLATRGMPARTAAGGDRLALWPGVRLAMRDLGLASTDWADAGQSLVTAWTKNRTTARLVGENGFQFDQSTDLPSAVLCDPAAVSFLRLRHLIVPAAESCAGWVPTSTRIDGRWTLAAWVEGDDARVRAIDAAALTDDLRRQPGLASGADLMRRLQPQDGSAVQIDVQRQTVRVSGIGPAQGARVYVLPIAYDPGWRATPGRTASIGGLLGIEGASGDAEARFTPDAALRIRAIGMALAQVLGAFGLVVLGLAGRPDRTA